MASINKLSIRGVRAFNPEDKEQVVEFYCPITIIVGSNGCGKTTVIECLKYAITGAYPPGCGRTGAQFVHDCKAVQQTTVKANVKLRFTSRSAQSMVVVRSMELTQKKSKATFKQLDGVLRMIDPDTNQKVSLSHKCSELDKQLPQLLGVSRAVLEHVIFCHQEDASWPLMEGAVLKKRFDDIFDSTKYTKALHVFRQQEKDFNNKAKELKVDLAAFSAHKQAAQGFKKECEEQNEALESVEDTKKEVSQKIEKYKTRQEKLNAIIEQVLDADEHIGQHRNALKENNLLMNQQRKLVESDLTQKHTLTDLKGMLSNFRSKMSDQRGKMRELEDEAKQLEQEMEKGREREKKLTSDLGRLTAEKESHEKSLRERYNKMERIAQKYQMDLTAMSQSQSQGASFIAASLSQSMLDGDDETLITISPEDMQSFFQSLKSKEEELASSLKDAEERNHADLNKIADEITDLGGKTKAIENDRSRLHDERRSLQQKLKELNDSLTGAPRTRKVDLEDAKKNAIRLAKERDDAQNDGRQNQIKMEIRAIEEKLEKLKRQKDDDEIIVQALKRTAESQNALAALREECAKDFAELEENMREESYSFTKFNISVPASLPNDGDDDGAQLTKVIEEMADEARSKHDAANDHFRNFSEEAANAQKVVSEKTALMTSNQRSLTQVKAKLQAASASVEKVKQVVAELRKLEEQQGEAAPPDSVTEEAPREILQFVNERVAAVEQSALDATYAPAVCKRLFKRLKKKAKSNLSCPCCKREMVTQDDLSGFTAGIKALEEEFTTVDPDAEEETQRLVGKYKSMRSTIEKSMEGLNDFRRLTGEEADLEKSVKKLQEEIVRFTSTLKDQKQSKDDAQGEIDELRLLIDLTRRWSDDAGRIVRKKVSIKQKQCDLDAVSNTNTTRDLKTVEHALSKCQDEREKLVTKTGELNKEASAILRYLSEKNSAVAMAEKLARDKEERFASEMKSSTRKQEIQKRLTDMAEEENQLSNQIAPLSVRLSKKEKEREKAYNFAKDEEREKSSELNAFKNDDRALRELEKRIDEYEKSSKPQEHEKIASKVAAIVSDVEAKKKELEALLPKLGDIKRAVDDQDRYKKNLSANIQILEAEETIKVLEKEIAELEEKRDAIEGSATAEKEFNDLKTKLEGLQQDLARLDGIWSSHVEQIRALTRKLKGEDYKNVDEDYRVCMIKYTTTKAAAEDLKKYANAMDKALLQFHGVKIKEINKIIRELWLLTYKGQDITNIEIQSGQEPGSKASKSYNYRVVMSKGGAKMDMRGRCSAGQRVLASIVIRLALAETFGVNFGCIALDEPTVNLDFANKKGLALALAQIVASRANQRNFQLVLITHDEDFVAMMKTELSTMTGFSMPENYFQVCREENHDGKFYSKVHTVDWDSLL